MVLFPLEEIDFLLKDFLFLLCPSNLVWDYTC